MGLHLHDARCGPGLMARNVARLRQETVPLADLLDSWVLELRGANKAANTVRTYSAGVRALIGWAGDGAHTGITTEDLRRFLADELASLAPSSVATHYRNLHVFFTWLAAEEPQLVPVNPMIRITPPTVPRRRKPPFSDGELRRLLAACAGSGFTERRDMAVLRVLIDTGMRVSSLAGLEYLPGDSERTSVQLGRRLLVVTLKGGDETGVPIGRKTCGALDRYLRARMRHPCAAEPGLWLGLRGSLSVSGIRELLALRARQAGVEGMHPHRFRRTLAHQWLLSGGTELDLMAITGWKTRAMIDVYAGELAEGRARIAHERLSPGDRL
jgi:site-specific recombinase XerD